MNVSQGGSGVPCMQSLKEVQDKNVSDDLILEERECSILIYPLFLNEKLIQ